MAKIKVGGILAVLCFLIDQITKWVVINHLPPYRSVSLIGDIVRFTHIRNPMAAWGIPISGTLSLVLLPAAIVVVILIYRFKARTLGERVALSLVLGGAAGNLLDRIRWGSVVDFIDIGVGTLRWPVFNLADAWVTVGIILVFYATLKKRK